MRSLHRMLCAKVSVGSERRYVMEIRLNNMFVRYLYGLQAIPPVVLTETNLNYTAPKPNSNMFGPAAVHAIPRSALNCIINHICMYALVPSLSPA